MTTDELKAAMLAAIQAFAIDHVGTPLPNEAAETIAALWLSFWQQG